MKTKICLIILILLCRSIGYSQDIHFSQFYMSPLTLNPGLAGVNYNFEALINYKDQWRGVATPYKTLAASLDARLKKKEYREGFWAAGLNFFRDKAGNAKLGISQINLTVAYHLSIAKFQTLGVGLQGGYAMRSINDNDLHWASQYDPDIGYNPNIPTGETSMMSSFSYGDVGGGIVWAFNNTSGTLHVSDNHDFKANVGIAVFHAKQKYSFYKNSNEKLYPKYVFHGDGLISLGSNNVALVPGFMYYRQGPAQEFYFGTMLRCVLRQYSKYTGIKKGASLSFGAYCRTKDAMTTNFLLEYSSYSLGVSYDINMSKLSKASNGHGGIEIALRYGVSTQSHKPTMQNFK
jgi:type IX secretion system PorP/SprF family membrane protein